MRPTDLLRIEHDCILRMMDVLESMIESIKPKDLQLLRVDQIIEFFDVYLEECHEKKEEKFLFPVIMNSYVSSELVDLTKVLMGEHRQGSAMIEDMRNALNSLMKNDGKSAPELVTAAKRLIEVFRAHIRNENEVAFPMVEDLITGQAQKQMIRKFERLEQSKMSLRKHDKFQRLLHKLSEEYLSEDRP